MGDDVPDFFASYRIAILGLGLMGGSLAMALHGKCSGFAASLPRSIRILLHWNTPLIQIIQPYLENAVRLRPNLINKS